ncbi:hypothetical protein BC567DRAFT_22605 [Phyllosticta citribraziliensis]
MCLPCGPKACSLLSSPFLLFCFQPFLDRPLDGPPRQYPLDTVRAREASHGSSLHRSIENSLDLPLDNVRQQPVLRQIGHYRCQSIAISRARLPFPPFSFPCSFFAQSLGLALDDPFRQCTPSDSYLRQFGHYHCQSTAKIGVRRQFSLFWFPSLCSASSAYPGQIFLHCPLLLVASADSQPA